MKRSFVVALIDRLYNRESIGNCVRSYAVERVDEQIVRARGRLYLNLYPRRPSIT